MSFLLSHRCARAHYLADSAPKANYTTELSRGEEEAQREDVRGGEGGRNEGGRERRTDSHDDKESREEAPEVQHGGAGALDEVVGVGAAAADPVGHGGEDVGGDDEEGQVLLEEGAGEDDEEEADGEDEGEGYDGLDAGGRHVGRFVRWWLLFIRGTFYFGGATQRSCRLRLVGEEARQLKEKETGRGCALRRGRFGRLLAVSFVMKVVVVAEW